MWCNSTIPHQLFSGVMVSTLVSGTNSSDSSSERTAKCSKKTSYFEFLGKIKKTLTSNFSLKLPYGVTCIAQDFGSWDLGSIPGRATILGVRGCTQIGFKSRAK